MAFAYLPNPHLLLFLHITLNLILSLTMYFLSVFKDPSTFTVELLSAAQGQPQLHHW